MIGDSTLICEKIKWRINWKIQLLILSFVTLMKSIIDLIISFKRGHNCSNSYDVLEFLNDIHLLLQWYWSSYRVLREAKFLPCEFMHWYKIKRYTGGCAQEMFLHSLFTRRKQQPGLKLFPSDLDE